MLIIGVKSVLRKLLRLARLGLLGYLVVCLMLSLLQESIIFPGASTQGQKHAVIVPAPNEELVRMRTPDGISIVALFGNALSLEGKELPDAAKRPTLLFFYGNGMCLADCAGEFRKFRRLGANVLIPEFVGYGMSGGETAQPGGFFTPPKTHARLPARPDIAQRKNISLCRV